MAQWLAALAFMLMAGTAPAALAQTDQERQAKLLAAIEACDKGASAPLDPTATAPPIQFSELFGPQFDLDALRAVADACKLAANGKPEATRLRLQWLRTEIALGERFEPSMIRPVRSLAGEGIAEANFLLFAIHRDYKDAGITLAEAQEALRAAAVAGHREALQIIVEEYRYGPFFRRDPREAARFAALLAELPRQGIGSPSHRDRQIQDEAALIAAGLALTSDAFATEEQERGFLVIRARYEKGDAGALIPYLTALRFGRGTHADPARARALLEEAVAAGDARALVMLAEMLAGGEGGPADGRRAIALLRSPLAEQAAHAARPVLAGLYLDNRHTGRRPREALRLLAGSTDIDARIRAAALFADYDEQLRYPAGYQATMDAATEVGEPGAAMAWARLKLSGHPQFGNDVEGARAILIRLAADGDREAALLVAETQYANLDSSSFNPQRRQGGMTDPEILTVVDAGVRDGLAVAFRVKAKLQRVGVVYPQDDAAATAALREAAARGDIEAMVLLGKAYADGLGVAKNPRERLRWWREAARLGSLEATERIADAFVFDSFDKLMTLREGITAKVALYNNGPDPDAFGGNLAVMALSGTFHGGRATEAGTAALAAAVMDAFRLAPAGLDEKRLLPLMRVLPDEIRIEIERVLANEGYYQGAAEGHFGPAVRAALAAWVDARGPLPDEPPASEPAPPTAVTAAEIPPEMLDRVRDRVFTEAMREDLTDDQRLAVIGEINVLAQYGEVASRWALLRNYHRSTLVRRVVSAGDITRYGLDLVVSRPEQAEKVDFEFIFTLSAMYEAGSQGEFGEAFLGAVRDDARLQDPLTLGGVMAQVMFAPGACDAILAAATGAGLSALGDDGCGEAARVAILAHAKEAGPAGIDAAIRAAAAETIRQMDAGG